MRARIPLIASVVLCTICGLSVPLLAQRPPGVDERFRQASEFMRNGNLNAAAEAFAAVVKEAPDFAPAHLNLGLVREEQGHHEEAIASFQKALLLNPKLRGANLFLGEGVRGFKEGVSGNGVKTTATTAPAQPVQSEKSAEDKPQV